MCTWIRICRMSSQPNQLCCRYFCRTISHRHVTALVDAYEWMGGAELFQLARLDREENRREKNISANPFVFSALGKNEQRIVSLLWTKNFNWVSQSKIELSSSGGSIVRTHACVSHEPWARSFFFVEMKWSDYLFSMVLVRAGIPDGLKMQWIEHLEKILHAHLYSRFMCSSSQLFMVFFSLFSSHSCSKIVPTAA